MAQTSSGRQQPATCGQPSMALWAAMQPASTSASHPSSVCAPGCKQVLKSQGPPPSSSPMPGFILPQGPLQIAPPRALGLLFRRCPLLPNRARSYPHPSQSALDLRLTKALATSALPNKPGQADRCLSSEHIIGGQSRRPGEVLLESNHKSSCLVSVTVTQFLTHPVESPSWKPIPHASS